MLIMMTYSLMILIIRRKMLLRNHKNRVTIKVLGTIIIEMTIIEIKRLWT